MRSVLRRLVLGAAFLAVLLQAAEVGAALGPIKIGFIAPRTGYAAPNGRDLTDGLMLALAQAGQQVAGRPIRVIADDDQNTPAQTLTKARKLVELDGVDVLFGVVSAASGYALRDYVDAHHVPTIYPVVASDDLTQRKRSAWIVRTGWSSSQPEHPFGEYAARVLRYHRIATIAYDFSFGWESVEGFQDTFERAGGRVVAHLWPPQGTPDYSPYLARIPLTGSDRVDAVFAVFSGTDALRFLQQYRAFGLEGRVPLLGGGTLTDEHILFQEGDLARGVITALHYSAALKTPANLDFVRAYTRASSRVPSYYAEGSYTAARILLAALEALHGRVEDKAALVGAMRRVVLPDAPRGPVRFDAWGNPIENVYIRRVDIVQGEPQNSVIFTYPHVSQFWTVPPEEYLREPVYTRDYPPAHP